MRRARWALGALLALWLLALGLLAAEPAARPPGAQGRPALRWADRWLYDLRLRALAPPQADAQIVIIDIDERALAEHVRWPWRRALLADLLAQAAGPGGARLLGLDMVLAEPDRSPGLAALRPPIDDDARLAAVLQRAPVVLGFHLSNEPGAARIGQLPAPLLPTALLGDQADGLLRWAGHGGSVPALQAAAQLGAGHLNALIDSDGVLRRLPLLVAHDGGVHGTLALVMARALLAGPATSSAAAVTDTVTVTVTDTDTDTVTATATGAALGAVALRVEPASGPLRALWLHGPAGSLRVPVDSQAVALLPYTAPGTGFVRHSAADVLAGRLAPDALRGKVVLVGVSAPGLIDQRATPVDTPMLGTLVHAHLLAGLLAGRVLVVPPQAALVEWLSLLLIGGALVLALPRLALWQGAVLAAGLVAGLIALHGVLWQQAGWVLPLASGLPLALLGLRLLLQYRHATGARRQLAQLFGQYVPPELVQVMSRAPERYSMRSRSAELTVLFADVQGFSAQAEHMAPAELGAMMNLLFSHLTDELRRHRGTLDKYIGDSVMAFWGAPLDDPDHARHAVAAALAMCWWGRPPTRRCSAPPSPRCAWRWGPCGCAAAMPRFGCGMCWPGRLANPATTARPARPTHWPVTGSACARPPTPAGWTRPTRCWTGWPPPTAARPVPLAAQPVAQRRAPAGAGHHAAAGLTGLRGLRRALAHPHPNPCIFHSRGLRAVDNCPNLLA